MTRHLMLNLALVLMASATDAPHPARPTLGPYKVAFWYEASRPTTSQKYQVYDLSKGEYDERAVDLWLRTILAKYPGHGAYVRDIRTEGLPGATEPERLALAIEQEKRRWADLNRRASRPIPGLVESTRSRTPPDRMQGRAPLDRRAPGSLGGDSNPPASPFPYPYRSGPR